MKTGDREAEKRLDLPLTDLGLLTTVGPRQGSVRFDANLEQHHHYV